MQSFPTNYKNGIPLTAMADWGWHSFPNDENLTESESQKTFDLGHGHSEVYAVEYKASKGDAPRNVAATEYFRVNPHRLNLGCIGLKLKHHSGDDMELAELTDIHQELSLYDGMIESHFSEGAISCP